MGVAVLLAHHVHMALQHHGFPFGHAEAGGACGLQLETAKDNVTGQALYEKLGYVRDEVFYTYWLGLRP